MLELPYADPLGTGLFLLDPDLATRIQICQFIRRTDPRITTRTRAKILRILPSEKRLSFSRWCPLPLEPEGGRIENIWQLFPLSYIVYKGTPTDSVWTALPFSGKSEQTMKPYKKAE
jgi:hypothetical protein